MALHGDIRVNHRKIGEWQAVCQPGTDGIHPYRWGATLNGVTVRGVLTHTRADGALVLASKVTAAAAVALAEATRAAESPAGAESHNPTLKTGVAQRGHGGPENGTPDLVAALRESIERARERRRADSRLPKCDEHGNPALFCDPCDMLNHARRSTAYHRADRTPGTKWLSNHQDKTLRRILADLPDRITTAYQVLDGEKLGDNEGGQSVPGSKPPLSLAVLDLTRTGTVHNDPIAHQTARSAGILTMLESWVRLAESEMLDCDQNPTEAPQHTTISSACAWLTRHIVWITEQQWVTELLVDLKQADTDVRHALRERAEYRPRCPKCGGWLEARFGFHACNACGHETSTRMVLALQAPMTADQMSQAFDVTVEAIWQWKSRGLLEPATGEDGQPLKSGKAYRFHVTDVLRLIDTSPKNAKTGS